MTRYKYKSNNKIIPPKSKQVCNTCKHWHKYGGGCFSAAAAVCSCGMYYPAYIKTR